MSGIGVGMALLIENEPRDRGLAPDGDPLPAGGRAELAPGFSVREALRSRRFLGLYAACFLCSFGLFVPFVHLVPFALDHGIRPASAVLLLGAIGMGSTAGRFFLGGLADRLGREFALMLMFAGMGLALLVWTMATAFWGMAGFALAFGVFYGGFVAFGTLLGPTAAGFAFDLSRSYTLPILLGVAGNLSAAAIILASPKTAAAISTA